MQTVWSRVAQAKCVCNCPSCLLTTNAVARRATTATVRRPIRVGNVFTVTLSSLAAGLAFTDSRNKDDRRKQWDQVILEARTAVEAKEMQQQRRLVALSDNAKAEAFENIKIHRLGVVAERKIIVMGRRKVRKSEKQDELVPTPDDGELAPTSNDGTDTWLDVFDWARQQDELREASGFQDWKGPSLDLLQSLSKDQLNELLLKERLLRRFYGGADCNNLVDESSRIHLSAKKIRTLEWSVAKMVIRLLKFGSTRNFSQSQKDSGFLANSFLRELFKDGENMQRKLEQAEKHLYTLSYMRGIGSDYDKIERPQMPCYDETAVEEDKQTTKMNESLQSLLELMKEGEDLNDLMSKICYNLLMARTPPNVHTYNMLLVRFCVLDSRGLVGTVLRSMRESHIRPNEITHVALLRHFNVTGKRGRFFHYWRLMEGHHRGLALLHPDIDIHPITKERYHIFGRFRHNAAEKARMNGQVYEPLIVGALRFLGSQIAMHYYRNMISEGWSPSLGIFLAILQDCCHRLDWGVGIAVLEQLEKTREKLNTLTYEWMLRLCQCCGQEEFFNQILRTGVHCGALPASMLDLPDHAKAEDIASLIKRGKDLQSRKANGTLKNTAQRIRRRLDARSPFLLGNILHDCEDEDTLRRTMEQTNDRWKARRALQTKLDILSTDINQTISQANHVLYTLRHISSIKFWLSGRIEDLEKKLKENTNSRAFASLSDLARCERIWRTHAGRVKDGEGQPGSSVSSPVIASFPGEKMNSASHPPAGNQQGAKEFALLTTNDESSRGQNLRSEDGCYGDSLAVALKRVPARPRSKKFPPTSKFQNW